MRIGFLVPSSFALTNEGNGARLQPVFQAEALRCLGHRVDLLNPWDAGNPSDYDVIQFFGGGYPFYNIETERDRMRGILVFAPMIDSNVSFRSYHLARLLGGVHPRFNTIPGVLYSQATGSDLVVCRSRHEVDRVVRGLGVSERNVLVREVLNGTLVQGFADPDFCRKTGNLPAEFVLHVSGYHQQRKNTVMLAKACVELGFPLVFAGIAEDGEVLRSLREIAAATSTITLLGFQPQNVLNSLYAACRVFALPSTHEGTGMVALDAAAQGAKVVITQNGGPPSYFGTMAHYVDPFSIESLKGAIKAAWEAPRSDELRVHVTTNLTWERSAKSLLAAYAEAARSRANG